MELSKLNIGKILLYSLGIGIVSSVIGAALNIRAFQIIGALGFLPLVIIIFLGGVGAFISMFDEILPEFKGKYFLLISLAILFGIIFIAFIYFGMGHESNTYNCPTYRGTSTCE